MVAALFVVTSPEPRLLLLSIDAIGVDIFTAICALYLRHHFALIAAVLVIPTLKIIYRFGPLPNFWPNSELLRSMPAFAAFAVAYPALWVLCAIVAVTDAILHWSVLQS